MQILLLSKKFPYPYKDGESIAVSNLAKALHELGAAVTLLVMNTSKHRVVVEELPEDFTTIFKTIHAVPVNNHITVFGAFTNLFFEKEAYHITRFISQDYEAKLIAILQTQTFEVIQLETIFLAAYLPTLRKYAPNAKIVLRSHNVEHEIWQRVADTSKNPFKKIYLSLMNPRLKRFEVQQLNDYDLILAITARDLKIFRDLGYYKSALVTPVGLPANEYIGNDQSFEKPLSLSFIGSLDWQPNQEGLMWFLEKVWAKVHALYPTLQFHIAGRNAPDWLQRIQYPNVVFHGEIESVKDFLNQHSVSIVPLLSGGGMRVKILESMLLGRVVISSSIGLEGIAAHHEQEVLIADSPQQWIDRIDWCMTATTQQLQNMSHAARQFSYQQYDNLHVARKVFEAYQVYVEK